MHIELSEVLVCPACGPDANLVLLVDERDGRWVRAGTLACSRCDARYPVRAGTIHFCGAAVSPDAPREGTEADGPSRTPGSAPGLPRPADVATEVAALLELHRRAGVVVLGPGLAAAARRVAELADRADVLLLAGRGEIAGPAGGSAGHQAAAEPREEAAEPRLTVASGLERGELPVRARRLAGVALWRPAADRLGEAAAALAPGGRLAGLRPSEEAREALNATGLEVVASEDRAFVAARPA